MLAMQREREEEQRKLRELEQQLLEDKVEFLVVQPSNHDLQDFDLIIYDFTRFTSIKGISTP